MAIRSSKRVAVSRPIARLLIALGIALGPFTTTAVVADAAPMTTSTTSTVVALEPARLLDTRPGSTTIDGEHAGRGPVSARTAIRVPVAGRGDVPDAAVAVIVNVTVVDPRGPGHLTVFPCGDVPNASTLNYAVGQTVANATLAGLDADGGLCISTYATAHVLVDVNGYLPNLDQWRPLEPARLYDNRPTGKTIDGQFQGYHSWRVGPSVQITGRGGVSTHQGEPVSAVALNVTAVAPVAAGHVTVRPCGMQTGTSTVNFGPGDTVANGIIVPVDIHGRVCIDAIGDPHVVIDVVGVDGTMSNSTEQAELETLVPARLVDSRPGGATTDGEYSGIGTSTAGGVVRVKVAGRGRVPDDAIAAMVNLTVVAPDQPGHSTVFPCTDDIPTASTSNVVKGQTVANTALAKLSPDGEICIYTHMSAHLVIDVLAATYTSTTP